MKHVIWDWNGTLLADAAVSCDITSSMLIRRGKPGLSLERFRSIMGCPYEEAYRKAGFDYSCESYESLALEWAAEYQKRWKEAQLRPGAAEFLIWVKRQGFTQSLLTASREDLAREQLDWYGLTDSFDLIMGVDNDLAEGKEHLAISHLAELGLKPEDLLLIGDTENDAVTASRIRCTALLLTGGHMDERRLRDTGLPVFSGFDEIRAKMMEMNAE